MSPSKMREILGPSPNEELYRQCRERVRKEMAELQVESRQQNERLEAVQWRIYTLERLTQRLREIIGTEAREGQ